MFKFGDGIKHWNDLIYSNQISSEDNNNTSLTVDSLHIGSNINGDYKGFSITAITKLPNDESFSGYYKISLKESADVSKLSVGDKIMISASSAICPITDIVDKSVTGAIFGDNDICVYLPNISDLGLNAKTDTGFKVYNFIIKLSDPTIGDKQVSYNTFTMGDNTKAIKRGASAFGENTIAYGSNSFAGGKGSTASDVGLAWGLDTNALNAGSVSFGQGNNSKGICSLTAGQINNANADNAIAVGYQNTTNAKNGFTIGKNNINNSENSLTVGYNLKLSEDNVDYDSDDVFVAGYNEPFLRVKKDGKTYIKNAVIGSTDIIDANTLMAKNVVSTKALHVGLGDSHFDGTLKISKLIDGSNRIYSPVYYWNFQYETIGKSSTKSYDLGNGQSYTITNDEKYSSQVITKITDTQDALILPDHVANKFHTNPNDLIVGIIKNTSGHSYSYVHLPNKLKFLGKNAFDYGCFEKIDLPNTLTHIGSDCFLTSRLLEINLPDSVEYVGSHAFYSCTRLRKVKWSSKCKTIPNGCFYNCTSLEEIDIPFGVTTIESDAFSGCSNLKRIILPTTISSIQNTAFDNISSDTVFYVEQGSYAETYAKENNIQFVYTIIDKDDYLANIQTLTIGKSYRTGQVAFIRDLSAVGSYRTFEIRVCQKDHTVTNELYAAWSNGEENFTDYWNGGPGILIESAVSDAQGDIIHETYETKDDATNKQMEADIYTDRQIDSLRSDVSNNYSRIPEVVFDISETYTMDLSTSDNHIIYANNAAGMLNPLSTLNLKFSTGSYSYTYTSEIIFTSGETATQIVYPNTGIINWIGTDCALSDGKSVFIPSPNTRYDVIISFDGKQLVGYVCGYTPATVNNG